MRNRGLLLGLLVIVMVAAVWQFGVRNNGMSLSQMTTLVRETVTSATGGKETVSASSGQGPVEIAPTPASGPYSIPAPVFPEPTEGEMFPFPKDTPFLAAPVPMPERRAPLVYFTYCMTSDDKLSSVSENFGEFYKFHTQGGGDGPLLVNPVPNRMLLRSAPFKTQMGVYTDGIKRDTYLQDAADLGADYIFAPVADGTPEDLTVNLTMINRRTSETKTWSSEGTGIKSVRELILAAGRESLKFMGYNDEEIAASKMDMGLPTDETFALLVRTGVQDRTFEFYRDAQRTDSDCVLLYFEDGGTTYIGQLVDAGLRRYPDDRRLIARKSQTLADAQTTGAAMRYLGAAMKRFPDYLMVYNAMSGVIFGSFIQTEPARETPQEFKAVLAQCDLFRKQYPECYYLDWIYAESTKHLGDFIRGGHTTDRIPDSVWRERSALVQEAFDIMRTLADEYPHHYGLQSVLLRYDSDVGEFGRGEQRKWIERVMSLNPQDTFAERTMASAHSIGYGSQKDYFAVMDRALLRHAGDPEALKELANALGFELTRQVGWKEMTEDEAYREENSYNRRFLQAAEFVYGKGMNLGSSGDHIYYSLVRSRGNTEKLAEWERTGQNSHYSAKLAGEHHSAGKWAECFRHAVAALPHVTDDDKGHLVYYYAVKSAWKLKNYDDSLKYAREGIFKFPHKQTFPYMYAIVSLECDRDLEVAYDCAWRAIDLGTGNDGLNKTFEKIRVKLNKPDHPLLAALK